MKNNILDLFAGKAKKEQPKPKRLYFNCEGNRIPKHQTGLEYLKGNNKVFHDMQD